MQLIEDHENVRITRLQLRDGIETVLNENYWAGVNDGKVEDEEIFEIELDMDLDDPDFDPGEGGSEGDR
jgi:hypothetical protein